MGSLKKALAAATSRFGLMMKSTVWPVTAITLVGCTVIAGGTTTVTGTLSAQGANGAGGQIETSGETLDLGAAKVDTHAQRGPLLITAGSEDHTVPLKPTQQAFHKYTGGPSETDFHEFDGRGHSLTLDHGWKDVATVALNWLAAKGF